MMKLVTEYLIIIEKRNPDALYHLCDSVEELNRLLQKDTDIVIDGTTVRYKEELVCDYCVTAGEVGGREQRFFHLKVAWEGSQDAIETYTALLKIIRRVLGTAGARVETLWDDVSLYYSEQAYPLIHRTENLMRKLIAYFMITNVGAEWISEAAPTTFQTAIERSKRKEYRDVLHQVDFADLGDLLFRSYQRVNPDNLYRVLKDAQELGVLSLDELKSFVPRSNWERYFAEVVECEAEYLRKRWEKLYDLRCKVAHNALVTKTDYDTIAQLAGEIEKPLQEAIDKLSEVHVPEEERETVAENVISSIDALSGEFVQLWRSFEAALAHAVDVRSMTTDTPTPIKLPIGMLKNLHHYGFIDEQVLEEGMDIVRFRNTLVHQSGTILDERELERQIDHIKSFIDLLQVSWKDEIRAALRALGGEAHLSDIYAYVEEYSIRRLPKTWQATVRYTLQIHCPETDSYKPGNEALFTQLGNGRWALRDQDSDNEENHPDDSSGVEAQIEE